MSNTTGNEFIRKVQKSRVGLYINLPKKLIDKLKLDGSEFVRLVHNPEDDSVQLNIGSWTDLKKK